MDKCERCKGTGKVSMDTGRKGGRPRIPCPECNGKGEMPSELERFREALAAIAAPCAAADYGWWTVTARKALGIATRNEQSTLGAAIALARGCQEPPSIPMRFASDAEVKS